MDQYGSKPCQFEHEGTEGSKQASRLLGELLNLRVNVAAVQKIHFICVADCQVLKSDFVVFLAFGSRCGAGVSLLVGLRLNANVNLVFAGNEGQLVVADIAVKTFKFWVVVVYAPNIAGERDAPSFGSWSHSWMTRSS